MTGFKLSVSLFSSCFFLVFVSFFIFSSRVFSSFIIFSLFLFFNCKFLELLFWDELIFFVSENCWFLEREISSSLSKSPFLIPFFRSNISSNNDFSFLIIFFPPFLIKLTFQFLYFPLKELVMDRQIHRLHIQYSIGY